MPTQVLEDFSAEAVIAAIEQSSVEEIATYVRLGGGQVQESQELLRACSGTPLAFFNGVLRTCLADTDHDKRIDATLAFFQERQQVMTWWVTPNTRPADLPQRLEARGLKLTIEDTGMAVDLQALDEHLSAPAALTIEQVQDQETMRDWLRIFALGFTLSEQVLADYARMALEVFSQGAMRYYLARLDGEPVATSALYPAERAALIEEVATIPQARRQGIGAAVTLAACRAGRALGYRIGVLYASEMGAPVYRRLGFQDYFVHKGYVWRP